jgi:hypothetical protein
MFQCGGGRLAERHDMHVQMGYTLADAIVDSDEGAVRFQATFDRPGQKLRSGHQRHEYRPG